MLVFVEGVCVRVGWKVWGRRNGGQEGREEGVWGSVAGQGGHGVSGVGGDGE